MFADTPFDAALYAGSADQIGNWAGTQAIRLLSEDMVPVCKPELLGAQSMLPAQALAALPLLQQSTRPTAWRHWFDALGVAAPLALAGPRYELFSMTAAAAVHGLGLALVPRLLIEAELQRGDLVVASQHAAPSERAYYLVMPERADERPVMKTFLAWLQRSASETT
jgi:LysR family glycine cleavage system transcriptional activator